MTRALSTKSNETHARIASNTCSIWSFRSFCKYYSIFCTCASRSRYRKISRSIMQTEDTNKHVRHRSINNTRSAQAKGKRTTNSKSTCTRHALRSTTGHNTRSSLHKSRTNVKKQNEGCTANAKDHTFQQLHAIPGEKMAAAIHTISRFSEWTFDEELHLFLSIHMLFSIEYLLLSRYESIVKSSDRYRYWRLFCPRTSIPCFLRNWVVFSLGSRNLKPTERKIQNHEFDSLLLQLDCVLLTDFRMHQTASDSVNLCFCSSNSQLVLKTPKLFMCMGSCDCMDLCSFHHSSFFCTNPAWRFWIPWPFWRLSFINSSRRKEKKHKNRQQEQKEQEAQQSRINSMKRRRTTLFQWLPLLHPLLIPRSQNHPSSLKCLLYPRQLHCDVPIDMMSFEAFFLISCKKCLWISSISSFHMRAAISRCRWRKESISGRKRKTFIFRRSHGHSTQITLCSYCSWRWTCDGAWLWILWTSFILSWQNLTLTPTERLLYQILILSSSLQNLSIRLRFSMASWHKRSKLLSTALIMIMIMIYKSANRTQTKIEKIQLEYNET